MCVCERELQESFIIPTMAHRLAFCGMIIRVSQSFVSSLSYLYWPSTSWSAKQGPRSLARPPAVAGGFASLQQPGMLHNLWLLGIHLRVARSLPRARPDSAEKERRNKESGHGHATMHHHDDMRIWDLEQQRIPSSSSYLPSTNSCGNTCRLDKLGSAGKEEN